MVAFLYFVALVGSRLASLASLLILARLMDPDTFGVFTICVTNALLAATLGGAWMTSGVTRLFPSQSAEDNSADIAAFAALVCRAAPVTTVAVLLATLLLTGQPSLLALMTALLALSLLVSDLGLAASNASGAHTTYVVASWVRGVAITVLPAAFFLFSGAIEWAVAGQVGGFLAGVALTPGTRELWLKALPWRWSSGRLRPYLDFGLAGTLLLAVYVLINAGLRNVLVGSGAATAGGHWALLSDLFWGPLALGTTTVTLIWLPKLYALNADPVARRVAADRYAGAIAFIVVPFVIAGGLIAPLVVGLAIPGPPTAELVLFGQLASAQAGVLALIYSMATILMADGRKRDVTILVLATGALSTLGLAVGIGADLSAGMALTVAVSLHATCLGAAVGWVLNRSLIHVRWKRVGLAAFCTLISLTTGFMVQMVSNAPWLSAAAFGLVYLLSTYLTGLLRPVIDTVFDPQRTEVLP